MIKLQGEILGIYIAALCGPVPPPAGGHGKTNPMVSVEEVEAVKDKGLIGDRWFDVKQFRFQNGKLKDFSHPRQVSLISSKAIVKLKKKFDIEAIDLRRNLLVGGVEFEDCIGKKFSIGEVVLEGTGLCRACKHIDDVTFPGVKDILKDFGGLRAKVLKSGTIQCGDLLCLI